MVSMFSLPWVAYIATFVIALGYFVLAKRCFDLLSIGFVGAAFYFSPLVFGYVVQSGPYDPTIPEPVFWIGTGYMVTLLVGAMLADRFGSKVPLRASEPRPMAFWYIGIAIAGLVGELLRSNGALIDVNKIAVLEKVGYLYAAFEIASALALLSAVIERRLWAGVIAACLLVIDVLIGFRFYAVLTALAVPVVLLRHCEPLRFWRKIPTYGLSAAAFVVIMLMANSARLELFNAFGKGLTSSAQMRGDVIQLLPDVQADQATAPALSTTPIELRVPDWVSAPLLIFMRSEPFLTQAVLVEIVRQNYSCEPINILKSIYLIVPPGLGKLLPNPFPPTFYDEFQPVLFPGIGYGLGGNVWAEMLCRFGYAGNAALALLLVASLIGLQRVIRRAPAHTVAPLALGGAVIAFYFHRNDLHYELVMLRQIALVFIIAWTASWAACFSRTILKKANPVETNES